VGDPARPPALAPVASLGHPRPGAQRRQRLDNRSRQAAQILSGRLLHTAYLLTGTDKAAEELAQRALARILVAQPHLAPDAAEPIAFAKMLRIYVRSGRWSSSDGDCGVIVAVDRRREPARCQRLDGLGPALARMPRKARAALVLRYGEGFSLTQTAETLGWSVSSVRRQAAVGLERLRMAGGQEAQEAVTLRRLAVFFHAHPIRPVGESDPGPEVIGRMARHIRVERRVWAALRSATIVVWSMMLIAVVLIASWLREPLG
jgi:DNA-directed RNA polymerase specialized sigma24 family protein